MIMGHSDGSIDDSYRERIDDARLLKVTDHVREWVFERKEYWNSKAGFSSHLGLGPPANGCHTGVTQNNEGHIG